MIWGIIYQEHYDVMKVPRYFFASGSMISLGGPHCTVDYYYTTPPLQKRK